MNRRTDLHVDPATASASFTSRYRLNRPLGRGGMGEVFAATDLELRREVALKRLAEPYATDDVARRRFLREAWALARVNHPNVVAVFDVGEHGDRPSFVMELLHGRSLAQRLEAEGPLPPAEAVSIARDVAAGLTAVHAGGIVHRDVKPSNVIITDDGTVKILDFGIARLDDVTRLTRTGQAFGSPTYMSPEQLTGDGGAVDGRADLYALGCVLFEMLAGRPPFTGDEPISVSFRKVHEPPPPLDAIRPGLTPELAALVGRLLAKDPNDRPGDAAAVVAELDVLRGVPAGAAAPDRVATRPLPSRVQRHEGRRSTAWIAVALAGLGALALLAVLVGFGVGSDRADAPAGDSPSVSATDASRATSPSSVPIVGGPVLASGALLDLTNRLLDSGLIDQHTASDIQHAVDEALRHGSEDHDLGKGLDRLDQLRDKIAESVDKGEVDPGAAAQLDAAIASFEATLGGD